MDPVRIPGPPEHRQRQPNTNYVKATHQIANHREAIPRNSAHITQTPTTTTTSATGQSYDGMGNPAKVCSPSLLVCSLTYTLNPCWCAH